MKNTVQIMPFKELFLQSISDMEGYSVFSYDKIEIQSEIHACKCILRQQAG